MQAEPQNAVAAIRVSTTKQGTDGDSPDAQKEQIERFAKNKGIVIKKFFVFLESASKEQQPMQEAIDYCKNPKNKIDLFIIKSIDRFTRGGSLSYDLLKNQLDASKVRLVDIYGVISSESVNTLDHLGFEYKWSRYSPSKKSEILEAERSKDELRDIMSRMIGAEIRYTQLGYWMRQPPYGYVSEKIETRNGKRCILRPHPEEATFVRKMYELRARGTLTDKQITAELNNQGFKTRIRYKRDRNDNNKVISQTGGQPLTEKAMQKMLRNPIYASVNEEKWTSSNPVKCVFDGIVDIELFNKANEGKVTITEDSDGKLAIQHGAPASYLVNKGVRNTEFAFRKYVLCPDCRKPLLGSSSRGKGGKYYPAYHCSNYGHYFRIPKAQFEETIAGFMSTLVFPKNTVDKVMQAIEAEWVRRQEDGEIVARRLEERIQTLRSEAQLTITKIKFLSSETAIKYMEEDLLKIERQIEQLINDKAIKMTEEKPDMKSILQRVKNLLEHPIELYEKQIDPIKKAQFFRLFFKDLPTYADLENRTPQKGILHPLLDIIKDPSITDESVMVIPAGLEPAIFWMRTRCPNR